MYGEPLQPNKCKFDIGVFDGYITISITDLDEEDNDDIRDVVHPDFEKYWDNDAENIFSTTHFKTMQEAQDWCISIGMEFDGINEESEETRDVPQNVSKYGRCSMQELKNMLQRAVNAEEFEEAGEINNEIKKRNE